MPILDEPDDTLVIVPIENAWLVCTKTNPTRTWSFSTVKDLIGWLSRHLETPETN